MTALVLAGVRLDPLNLEDATDWVLNRATAHQAAVVATPNIQHFALARGDESFRLALQRSDLSVADGWPILLAARVLGTRLPGRVAGVDLVANVLQKASSLRLAILGSGAAELAAAVDSRHQVVLVEPLEKGVWETSAFRAQLKRRVSEAAPTLVLVGISAPNREYLAESLRACAHGPIICCGAAVEILAGLRPRAPQWFVRMRLEWLFRITLEPRRLLPRYARAGYSFAAVVRSAWSERRNAARCR